MGISLNEDLISPKDAAKMLPHTRGGRPVHVATLFRWSNHGLRGRRLETLKIGRSTVTSEQALQRFFDQLTAKSAKTGPPPAGKQAGTNSQVERLLDEFNI